MGGDGWSDTGPYQQDIAAAFRRVQEDALAQGNYGDGVRTIEQLWEDPDWQEAIFTGGTASVLDFFEFVSGEGQEDDAGRMRLLTDAEIRAWAPSGQPTYAEWNEALRSEDLWDFGRACGNCVVLYRDGQATEIGYWGITAD